MAKYDNYSKNELYNELLECSKLGDNENIIELVRYKIDLNHIDERGNTALLFALKNSHFDTADILVKYGADVNIKDENGCSSLLRLVIDRNAAAVEYLINHGVGVDCTDQKGAGPLLLSVVVGDIAMMSMLLKHGANPNIREGKWTPLVAATAGTKYSFLNEQFDLKETIGNKRQNFIIKLIQAGGNYKEKIGDAYLLLWAILGKWSDVYKFLISKELDQDSLDEAIWYSVPKQKVEVTKSLIQKGANVNREYQGDKEIVAHTLLGRAVLNNHVDMVKLLIESGADTSNVTIKGHTALQLATEQGKNQVAEYLINGSQVSTDQLSETADKYRSLISASANGNFEMVEQLIESGANVNATGEDGFSALIAASYNGYLDIVKTLMNNGATINYQSPVRAGGISARTALSQAILGGHANVARYLLEQGARFSVWEHVFFKYFTKPKKLNSEVRDSFAAILDENPMPSDVIDILAHHYNKQLIRKNLIIMVVVISVILVGVLIENALVVIIFGLVAGISGAIINRFGVKKRKTGKVKHLTVTRV